MLCFSMESCVILCCKYGELCNGVLLVRRDVCCYYGELCDGVLLVWRVA